MSRRQSIEQAKREALDKILKTYSTTCKKCGQRVFVGKDVGQKNSPEILLDRTIVPYAIVGSENRVVRVEAMFPHWKNCRGNGR